MLSHSMNILGTEFRGRTVGKGNEPQVFGQNDLSPPYGIPSQTSRLQALLKVRPQILFDYPAMGISVG